MFFSMMILHLRPVILPNWKAFSASSVFVGFGGFSNSVVDYVRFVTNFYNTLPLIPNCPTSMQILDLCNRHNTPLTCVLVGVCRIQDSAWGSAPWGCSWDLVWAKRSCQQWPTSSVTGGGSWCPWQSLGGCTSPSGGKLMNWHSTQSSWGPWTWSKCTN